ncbi:hypothetical protein EON67_06225 [archaeon]|nr:MAG: hypothetical protein EON67_06225 [archaeon]
MIMMRCVATPRACAWLLCARACVPAHAPSRHSLRPCSVAAGVRARSCVQVKGMITTLCDEVLAGARTLLPDYKLLVSASLVQRGSAVAGPAGGAVAGSGGLHTHAACYWEPGSDGCITATVETAHIVAIVHVFAVAY